LALRCSMSEFVSSIKTGGGESNTNLDWNPRNKVG
jgi:hypothetical protein